MAAVCMLLAWWGCALAWAGVTQLEGFPVSTGGENYSNALVAADLDLDGKSEIIVTSGGSVTVVQGDGTVRAGFPVAMHPVGKGGIIISAAPGVCDLRGDGHPVIILGASDAQVFAIDAGGRPVSGFPVTLDGAPSGAPACVPNGNRHDIAMTTTAGSLFLIPGSGKSARKLARIGAEAESGVGVADLDADGVFDLVVGGGDSRVYVVNTAGKRWRPFAYKTSFRVGGVPAIGDLDDDGRPDIVLGSQDYKIHAVDVTGKALPGFPVSTGYRIYGGASLGDLDGDGVLDVVVGSGDAKLYAVHGDGKPIDGFPVKLDGRLNAACVLGDLTVDGLQEIVAVTRAGSLYVINGQGRRLRGFPVNLGGLSEIAPVLADLDGDGQAEIVAQAKDGPLHAYKIPPRNQTKVSLLAWPTLGHDAAHTGRFAPNAARFKDLTLANPVPTTTDALQVAYTFFDLDNDVETNTQIRWFVDKRPLPELDNKREVPAEMTRKHQRWHYTLQEGSNLEMFGTKGPLARQFTSPAVEIGNTVPSVPSVSLLPEVAKTSDDLALKITQEATDPDGDKVIYRTIWFRDDKPEKMRGSQTRVEAKRTRKNEIWRVVVIPFDGEAEGERAQASRKIVNSPPKAPRVALVPEKPRIDDVVKVQIVEPAADPDRDPIHYAYAYWVDDKPLFLSQDVGTVAPRTLAKHMTVRVLVTAWDDEEPGGQAEARGVLSNTPPVAPKIAIWPPKPQTEDDLVVGVLEQDVDRDGDALHLNHRWSVDGKPADFGRTVPASATRRGQRWRLEVTPFDGEAEGKPSVAETTIVNSPPTAPGISLDTHEVHTDETVSPKVVLNARDPDGDPVRLKYVWLRNGQRVATLGEEVATLSPDKTHKGELWQVRVRSHDGTAAGGEASLHFRIRNTPPSAPQVAFSQSRPTVMDRVDVSIVKPAVDKDGDKLRYNYRWLQNGVVQKKWAADKKHLAPGEGVKGDTWRIEVRAFDGDEEGPAGIAELAVSNHAPGAPSVVLLPSQPKTTDDLRCDVAEASVDPDGDGVTYQAVWYKGEDRMPLSPDLLILSSSLTRTGDMWRCDVQARDGDLLSPVAHSAAVTILNSPPEAPVLAIAPTNPKTDDDLRCELQQPGADPDLDALSYGFRWQVDGKPWNWKDTAAPNRVPAAATSKGQTWSCEVIPRDGHVDGATAMARVRVGNSKPTTPTVRVVPKNPIPGKKLSCEIVEPSTDADGDEVTYAFKWVRDGVEQTFARTSRDVPARLVRARDMWTCRVTPSDGATEGEESVSAEAIVGMDAEVGKSRRPGS